MKKFLNYCIALLLPTMVSCGGNKIHVRPEVKYGAPMPEEEPAIGTRPEYEDPMPPRKYGCPMPEENMNVRKQPTEEDVILEVQK